MGKILKISLQENEILVSFDVVSLFTTVPINDAKKILEKNWSQIKQFTNSNKKEFSHLVSLCLDNSYCQFGDEFFLQKEGLPMGSSLSPIIADIFLDDLFTQMLQNFPDNIKFVVKYVDDTFFILNKIKLIEIFDYLNNFHPNLKFTMEEENNRCINFLYVTICITPDNNIEFQH